MDDSGILGVACKRRTMGITLQQIAAVTKIGVRLLEAIEYGEFQKLPGGIYNTSYIRQYARAIDFDEYELLKYYQAYAKTAGTGENPGKPDISKFTPLLQE